MCGICGVVQLGGEPRPLLAPGALDRMTDVMRHRGPDDRGTYTDLGIALGVRRLSIIDVVGGHQPVSNEHGTVWAIQNGELYNHESIRADLARRGHRFRSRCDTEILPHLYEQHGSRFMTELNGMFALAVWDAEERRAVLVRDRLGVKPLYYAQVDDTLVFGSELKSLLASGLLSPSLDYQAIDAFLRLGYFPAPRTPLAEVSKLLPGHRLVADRRGARVERWWSFPEPAVRRQASLVENAEELLELLEDAVRLRLMTDVPLGAMLSGGLDSSLLVALMARNMSEPVKTFSVGFGQDPRTSELADARTVARALGTEHHELELSFSDLPVDLRELVWFQDEPVADLSSLGFFVLSELASRHVTVALCGQGPDELYGGYLKHRVASLLGGGTIRPLMAAVARTLAHRSGRIGRVARTLAADGAAGRLLAMSGLLDDQERLDLVRGPLAALDGQEARRSIERVAPASPHGPLEETLFIDGQLALVDDMLHFSDRMSMAHSLEVRVPYLDYRLVEQSASFPESHKVRRLATKRVLKEAASELVPREIAHKRKIGFFSSAMNTWLGDHVSSTLAEHLLDPAARSAEFLDRRAVERLIRGHTARTEKQGGRLLIAILMLEIWLTSYLDRAVPAVDSPAAAPAA